MTGPSGNPAAFYTGGKPACLLLVGSGGSALDRPAALGCRVNAQQCIYRELNMAQLSKLLSLLWEVNFTGVESGLEGFTYDTGAKGRVQ